MAKITPILVAQDLHYDWHEQQFKNLTSTEAGKALKVLKLYASAYNIEKQVDCIVQLRRLLRKREKRMKLAGNFTTYEYDTIEKLFYSTLVDGIYKQLCSQ